MMLSAFLASGFLDCLLTVVGVNPAGYLNLAREIAGPYLVVVPLSTVPNWIKEFQKWLPQVNALVYVGDSKSREVALPPCSWQHLPHTCLAQQLHLVRCRLHVLWFGKHVTAHNNGCHCATCMPMEHSL